MRDEQQVMNRTPVDPVFMPSGGAAKAMCCSSQNIVEEAFTPLWYAAGGLIDPSFYGGNALATTPKQTPEALVLQHAGVGPRARQTAVEFGFGRTPPIRQPLRSAVRILLIRSPVPKSTGLIRLRRKRA